MSSSTACTDIAGNLADTDGIDWLELPVQLVVAVIVAGAVGGIYSRRGATHQDARR